MAVAEIRGWGYLSRNDSNTASQIQDANARLIAAAPELLAALKNFVETLELFDPGVYRDAIDEANAAIAKATVLVGRAPAYRAAMKDRGRKT